MLEQALTQLHFHLPAHAEDELARDQSNDPHGARKKHDPSRLAQDPGVTESLLQLIHDAADLHRDRHPQDVDHNQCNGSQQDGASMGSQVAADQVET